MKKVYLDGYIANNLGDDLFITMICNRYPNVEFHLIGYYSINPMPANLIIHRIPIKNKIINRLERLTKRIETDSYINGHIKSKDYDCLIRIIGSGYMQKDKVFSPINPIYDNLFYKENSYVVGCNFGPYYSDEFLSYYKELFKKLSGITFRDQYSYLLFKELDHSVVAPDILFGLDISSYNIEKNRNSVLISVMDLSYGDYINRAEYNHEYYRVIKDTIQKLIDKGYQVTLLGMCEIEGDYGVAQRLQKDLIPLKINIISYPTNNIREVLDTIAKSEYIISTRFHSFVLGTVFGCKILPISYNIKIENTINEVGFKEDYITLNQLRDLDGTGVVNKLINNQFFEAPNYIKANAQRHFCFIDERLKDHN